MASFVIDLGKTLVERLMDWTIGESRYLICFTCVVEEFQKEQEALKGEMKTLEERVKVAKNQGNRNQPNVTFWQEEATKLIQDQEDTKTRMTCFFGLCPNCKGRYSRGKELADKTQEIRKLMQRNFESVGLPPDLPGVEYHSSQHYILFKSREQKYKELLDALSDDNNYITGLQGMGGTGKTTLAKQVGKTLKQSKQFDYVLDTTVSNTPDIKKIQDDIAGPLGLSLKDYNESERPKILWTRLTNGEKILLILDDVWGYIKFEEIGIPCSGDHKGCRVLLTTRNQWVCNSLGCERTIQLELLSAEDAWVLFKEHAGIKDGFPMGLLEKGRKIVKECKGLPVAIAAMASSLKGQKRKDDWDAALKSLKKPMSMRGVDENMIDVYKCLRHSYNNLKNEEAKELFLLCSLFPEDTEIPIQILTRLAIAAGILGELDGNYYEARGQVVRAKNKLIDSCLLLTASEGGMEHYDLFGKKAPWIDGRVKMHDLVREVALWVANKKIQAINLSNKTHKSMVERENDIEYLLCEGKGKDVFSYKVNGSSLKLLVVYDIHADEDGDSTLIIPVSFFENMTSLRALFLSCNSRKNMMALSLPQSTQLLTNIRSVYLKSLELGDISILGNLRSLETLELLRCSIDELPGAISKLNKFRLLTLNFCQIRRNNPFEVIKRCSSLEELYLYIGESDFQVDNVTLPELQRYHISEKDFGNENCSQLNFVRFSEIDGFFSQSTFKYLMKKTEVLQLTGIKGAWANLIPEIIPSMSDVVHLHLKSCSQIQCLIDCITTRPDNSNILPKLAALSLVEMEKLIALCNGPIPFNLLKNLESLEIEKCKQLQGRLFKSELYLGNLKSLGLYNCPKLVSLFQLSASQRLVLLEELRIKDCEQLKSIITDEGQGEEPEEEIVDADNNDNKNHGSMFPSLRILDIFKCPQLESVLPFLSAQGFPLLKFIYIRDCDRLKYIFGQYQIELKGQDLHKEENDVLGSLTILELENVPNFIDIFPEFYHPLCSSKRSLSSRDYSKAQIQLDSTRSNIFPWNLICCYAHKYRSNWRSATSTKIPPVFSDQLQDSSILSLWERAKSLPKQLQILQNVNLFRNTKEIFLHRVKVEFLFVLSIVPTMLLESLQLWRCDELKYIIVDTGNEHENRKLGDVFPKLRRLTVEYCEQIEYIFGHHCSHDHEIHNEIHIHLPALEYVEFYKLPNLIGICPESYCTTLPQSLTTSILLNGCSKLTIKHIDELFITDLNSRQLGNSTVKDMGENVMNSKLERILLGDLSVMTSLFVGPKYSTSLENLRWLNIRRCEKVVVVFSACVVRCLPHLNSLTIEECKELKQIFEDNDVESEKTKTMACFPKLKFVDVKKCNRLKCVFQTSKEVPANLHCLTIVEASELEQVFQCGDQRVELPNLEAAVLVKLPRLCGGIDYLQTAKHVFMDKCPNLPSSSSAIPQNRWSQIIDDDKEMDSYLRIDLNNTFNKLKAEDTKDENSTREIVENVPAESEIEVAPLTSLQQQSSKHSKSEHPVDGSPQGSQENVDGQVPISSFQVVTKEHCTCARDKYERDGFSKSLFEDTVRDEHNTSKAQDSSNENNPITENTPDFQAVSEVQTTPGHELISTLLGSNGIESNELISMKTKTKSKQENEHETDPSFGIPSSTTSPGINRNVEEGTTSTNDKALTSSLTSSTHGESVSLLAESLLFFENKTYPKEDIDASHSHETSKLVIATEIYASVYANDDASLKASSIVKEQFPNNPNIGVPEFMKSSHTILSPSASQIPSIPLDGSELIGEPCPSPPDIPLRETHSYELLGGQSIGELHLMNKQLQPIGETNITFEIPQENGEGQIAIPSFPSVTTGLPITIGDSQETIGILTPGDSIEGIDEINKMIIEDPLSAFEKLLTGKVSVSSKSHLTYIGILLQDLKALIDSDFENLISCEDSRLKLVSLLERLNQHQRFLSPDTKEFVNNVKNFFNDFSDRHATLQQVTEKHKQLIQSKADLLNKLSNAKSTQAHIDNTTSTAKNRMYELSLQMDDLRKQLADMEHERDDLQIAVNECEIQKKNLKDECTQLAQQSTELLFALVSSEINVQEVEHATNLAKEAFANLKSSFPSF